MRDLQRLHDSFARAGVVKESGSCHCDRDTVHATCALHLVEVKLVIGLATEYYDGADKEAGREVVPDLPVGDLEWIRSRSATVALTRLGPGYYKRVATTYNQ